MLPTPGISTGYWKARNTPRAARSSGVSAEQVLAVEAHLPGRPRSRRGRPAPGRACSCPRRSGPMIACTSPALHVRSSPCRICLPSTLAREVLECSQHGHPTLPSEADAQQRPAPRRRTPSAAPGTPPCRSRSRSSRPRPPRRCRAGGSRRAGPRRSSTSTPRARPARWGCSPRCTGRCARRTRRRSAASRTGCSCARRRPPQHLHQAAVGVLRRGRPRCPWR